jgi:hypothetical protein
MNSVAGGRGCFRWNCYRGTPQEPVFVLCMARFGSTLCALDDPAKSGRVVY